MTLGSGDKKLKLYPHGVLAVLGTFAVYMVYSNLLSGPPGAPADTRPRATATSGTVLPASTESPGPRRTVARARNEEFHPVLHSKRPEDRIDPSKIDPTLQLDLLKKVMAVTASGGARNLFTFSQPVKVADATLKGPETRIVPYGPPEVKPPPPAIPQDQIPPTPLTLKYYGFSTTRDNGKKSAYFLDADSRPPGEYEILIVSEGDTLKRRYRVLRIGPSAVVVEDTENKKQQSVPITPDVLGS